MRHIKPKFCNSKQKQGNKHFIDIQRNYIINLNLTY